MSDISRIPLVAGDTERALCDLGEHDVKDYFSSFTSADMLQTILPKQRKVLMLSIALTEQ